MVENHQCCTKTLRPINCHKVNNEILKLAFKLYLINLHRAEVFSSKIQTKIEITF